MASTVGDTLVFGSRYTAPVRRAVSAYGRRYGAALTQPFAVLVGQALIFFVISLYVKLTEMRDTAEYAGPWLTNGRLAINTLHSVLFCGQEIFVFGSLLVAIAVWHRGNPRAGKLTHGLAWTFGLVVLPALSVIEVLGLAHFALFLTPLGPEELRLVGWTGQVLSAGNVFNEPDVFTGLVLVVVCYYLVPPALWLSRLRTWAGRTMAPAGVVLLAGMLAAQAPKPPITNALLVPHPVIWLFLGSRPEQIWDENAGIGFTPASFQVPHNDSYATLLAPFDARGASRTSKAIGRGGRGHFSVQKRPTNVLIFVLESVRAASVAVYNPATPAGRGLQRLRDEMVVFDQLYAPVPTSAHAIFSILYGAYPYLGPFWTSTGKSVVADSMAQLFTRAGYTTHFYITGDLDYDNIRSFAAPGFSRVLDINDWPGQEQYAAQPWGRDDRLLVDEIKRFLTTQKGRPFLLFAMTSNPHHPYSVDHLPPLPSAPSPDEDPKAAYERLVDYDLQLLAELYEWMKHRGIAQDTLLLVLGDHGEAFGEHPGDFGHAAFIYEENVHVPCFILHPRRLGLPRHIAQLGSQVDLRATILDILGWRDTASGDGVSLLREEPERMIANLTENGVSHFGVRDARYSYIYTPHVAVEQVFDRASDPGETHDIAADAPAITARYRTRLQRWEVEHQLSLARVLR